MDDCVKSIKQAPRVRPASDADFHNSVPYCHVIPSYKLHNKFPFLSVHGEFQGTVNGTES